MNKSIVLKIADIYLRFPEIMEEEFDDLLDFLETENIVYEGATDIFIEKDKEIERLNNIINELEKVADARMNIILKIEQYLIDSGVDDDILKCCNIYDVNGVELRKYIEELKGDDSNE